MNTPDFMVENLGTIWMFTPKTKTARKFVTHELHVEGWQYLGAGFGVDHRMAEGLLARINDEGLTIGGAT